MPDSHIETVRKALIDTLADLRCKDNPMDIARARAVAEVATVLVDTARVENDYLKITGQDHSKFLELPPDTGVAHLGNTATGSVTALPSPGNGITGITQHRMRG
jgi:hypothetical protein